MADEKEYTCKLCLKSICDKNFKFLDNDNLEILKTLLVNIDNKRDEVICGSCYSVMQTCFQFKRTCLNMDDYLTPLSENGAGKNLLKVLEHKVKDTGGVNLENRKICQLCLNLIEDDLFREIEDNSNLLNDLNKCLPELKFKFICGALICGQCISNLSVYSNFQECCLHSFEYIVPKEENTKTLDDSSHLGTIDWENGLNEIKVEIKEEILLTNSTSEDIHTCFIKEETNCDNFDAGNTYATKTEVDMFKYEMGDFATEYKGAHKGHMLIHTQPTNVKRFKCEICEFSTKRKANLERHMLIHGYPVGNPVGTKTFQCETCVYSTKRKENLKRHMLLHRNPAELKMFQCELCGFSTKYKHRLKEHVLIHKPPTEVKMFQCKTCEYSTKHRGSLRSHLLIHKDISEVEMFKCEMCGYSTKHKRAIQIHMLRHKNFSEAELFKCETCKYSTKYKGALKSHMLTHERPTKIEKLNCEMCEYTTKHKRALKTHMLRHKNPPEVKLFKCGMCKYSTKYKWTLKRHAMSIHEKPSDIKSFSVDCTYSA